jgi:hypothetical protein
MKVETFEINEHLENHLEINDEQLKLIEELGLEGQKTLIGESSNKTLCMYPQVTEEQSFIIKTLCPKKFNFKDYKRMQIPLRVMQVIAHVIQENYFDHLCIFDKKEEAIKDPFLLGVKGDWHRGEYFLLARWGEELLSWKELAIEAKNLWAEKRKIMVSKIIREMNESDASYHVAIQKPSLQDWD